MNVEDEIVSVEVRCGEEIVGAADFPPERPATVIIEIQGSTCARAAILRYLARDGALIAAKPMSNAISKGDAVSVTVTRGGEAWAQ